MKNYLLFFLLSISIMSCERYDEELIPLAGVYEGVLVGDGAIFTMSISVDRNDIILDAPFDGFEFAILESNVRNEDQEVFDLDFCNQEIYPDVFICGEGFYSYGDLQLNYELDFGFGVQEFILVATKY